MKSRQNLAIDEYELNQLLDSNSDDNIWSQRVNSTRLLFNSSAQLFIAAICLYYLRDLFNIALTLILVIPYLVAIYLSITMEYSIMPNGIKFKWGIINRKKVFIPFEDITAINLVKYDHGKYSTIHFGTRNEYQVKKISLIDAESRPHITFENIKYGDKVYELLQMLWKRKTSNLKLKDMISRKRKEKVVLKSRKNL